MEDCNHIVELSGGGIDEQGSFDTYMCYKCNGQEEKAYQPELGQLLNGYAEGIDFDTLDNASEMEYLLRVLSFKATGSSGYSDDFNNGMFSFKPYYWGDDEEESEKPNFKFQDLEIRWYKYIGRGMVVNRTICFDCFLNIFMRCIKCL